jgi:indole-3-glycerol phosphate synthase
VYDIRTTAEVQANRAWTAPLGPLGRLSKAAADRAAELERRSGELQAVAAATPPGAPFADALRRPDVAVIAEVKRRSPSKGVINAGIDAAAQAAAYARGGASALSILTEPSEFGGSTEDLHRAREATNLPTLKKDFHVHPAQVLEARAAGASAMLLIARALPPGQLGDLAGYARELGVEVLIEVRGERELEDALAVDDAPIGVNSRDLETLIIEPEVTSRLLALIPPHRIAIAESGVASRADVMHVASLGADAVLVGSSVSAAPDPASAVAALAGVPRMRRVG